MDTSDQETMPPFKEFLLTFFMPEKCFNHFFLHYNFIHVPCLRIVLSKVMGVFILMGVVIAPLPQICKVLWSGSSDGLSLASVFLELMAISTHAAFCCTQKFPIGAWGESLFGLIQFAVLALLVQHYRDKSIKGILQLLLYGGAMYFLTSPVAPATVVWTLHEWNVVLIIAARFLQAGNNCRYGSTGQLSALFIFLGFLGSLGRVFSSLQDTGLFSFSSQLHALATCCSGVLLAQILLCWNKRTANSDKEARGVKKDKAD